MRSLFCRLSPVGKLGVVLLGGMGALLTLNTAYTMVLAATARPTRETAIRAAQSVMLDISEKTGKNVFFTNDEEVYVSGEQAVAGQIQGVSVRGHVRFWNMAVSDQPGPDVPYHCDLQWYGPPDKYQLINLTVNDVPCIGNPVQVGNEPATGHGIYPR